MVDVARMRTKLGIDASGASKHVLRALLPWWLGLLAVVVALGELVVHADHGVVLRRIDAPVDADLQPAGHTLHSVAAVVTWIGAQPVIIVLLAVFAAMLYRVRNVLAVELVVIVIGADALTTAGKLVIQRAGPAQRLTSGLNDYSFPSGHTTAASALLIGTALLFSSDARASGRAARSMIGLAVAVAVVVAFSRLVLDVHWLTDVCAGFAVGTVWAVLVVRLWPAVTVAAPTRSLTPTSID